MGQMACIADRWGGLQIIDVAEPLAPEFAGSYLALREAFTVAVEGDHLYVGEYFDYYTSLIDFSIGAGVVGDVNGDGAVTSSDVIYSVNYSFKGGPPPVSPSLADVNCSGSITTVDLIHIVNFVFRGGALPGCD
jgi:hypothetical protein